MASYKDVYAEYMVTSFLRGKDSPKAKALAITWELIGQIHPAPDKRPEDVMTMHTVMVALRNRGYNICAGLSCESN